MPADGVDAPIAAPIAYVDLARQAQDEREMLHRALDEVIDSGFFVGGGLIEELEAKLAAFCGVKEAVVLASGTDALELGMRALGIGPGDEVITPPNSFVASTGAVVAIGATPVFVDVQHDQNIDPNLIEAAITPRTRAIMPVHLSGRIADMNPIMDIAKRHSLMVVEDAAQAIGSRYDGKPAGSFGDIGCFSTHPLKNLNACGDGGFLTTNNPEVAAKVRLLRNHGLADRNTVEEFATVARMDTFQAAILLKRLETLGGVSEARRKNAALYRALLDPALVYSPPCRNIEYNTFHTFVVQVDDRDGLQAYLRSRGIGTAIHYPIPIHLQPAARDLGCGPGDFPVTEEQAGRILTLPVHQYLTEAEIRRVADEVNGYLSRKAA
jgi:dTDP-4-amino-4,6-dideoxygalactose transaminase